MRIQWTGKTRVKVEGIGYVAPGGEVEVLDSVGNDLCSGGEFREVGAKDFSPLRARNRKTKRQKHRTAAESAAQEEV